MSDLIVRWDVVAPLLALVVLAAFLLGRRTGGAARRVRELESALAQTSEERDAARQELGGYQRRVTDHFTETSHRLHDLTLQYRAVYDHLAKGASELCPGGFEKLEGGLGLDALPEESSAREPDADDDEAASSR